MRALLRFRTPRVYHAAILNFEQMLRWDIGLLTQRYIALYEQGRYQVLRPAATPARDECGF
jgi:hypothetical protein